MATKTAIEALSAKERRMLRLIDDPRTSAITFMHIENAIFNSEERSHLYATPDIVYHLAVSPRVSDMALRKMATISMVPPGIDEYDKTSLGEIEYLMQCSEYVKKIATSNLVKRSGLPEDEMYSFISGINASDSQGERVNKVMKTACELPVSAPRYRETETDRSAFALPPLLRVGEPTKTKKYVN